MLYCFLAGIAVSHSKLLWVMPAASAAYLLLLSAILLSLDSLPLLQNTIRYVVFMSCLGRVCYRAFPMISDLFLSSGEIVANGPA